MLDIYKPYSGLDWMNYKIIRKDMTAHHIIKAEHGGLLRMDNIALLMSVSHRYLHLIECKDYKTYKHLNDMFRIINDQRHEPSKDQREIVEYLLEEFEKIHSNDKTSKGKKLIREEYLNRTL